MTTTTNGPTCDMADDCTNPVTHIGNRGYVYCARHGAMRRAHGHESTRRMRKWERDLIAEGKPLPSYTPGPKPTTTN